MVVHAPERSLQQRMDALQNANRIRSARATLKLDMKYGDKSAAELLKDPPEFILTMKLFNLLLAEKKIGRVKANKILQQCRISPSKTVEGLTERQRDEVLAYISK